MPKFGLTMKKGTIVKWLVSEGTPVEAGSPIAEIMTEKISNQLEAPVAGSLLRIVVDKGATVPVGTPIAILGEPDEDIEALIASCAKAASTATTTAGGGSPSAERVTVAASPDGRVSATPAARKLAQELGVDLHCVPGTGADGRVTREDVLAADVADIVAEEARTSQRDIEYSGMRRAIGEHMAMSWTIAPKVTHHSTVDVTELMAFRARLNHGRKERDKLSVTAILVKAVANALTRMPEVNASLDGDVIHIWQEINVGVAMALPGGLIVPVVRDADKKGFSDIGREISAFSRKAARNRLEPDDLVGGTFTITNVGGYKSVDWFTPIINQPESAILGVGRIVDSVVAVDGSPVVRPTMGLSLSFDHRVLDGAPAASFLALLMALVTNPYAMVG